MLHETDRPCFNCAARRLLVQFHILYGYTAHDLLNHVTDLLADLVAESAVDGHEQQAEATINKMFTLLLKSAFERGAQRRAAEAPGPKEPTVVGIGHA